MKSIPGLLLFLLITTFSCAKNKSQATSQDNGDENGKLAFTKFCMACHQADGSGVPGMYPPLKQSDWVQGEKVRLIKILLNGLEGEITVNGNTFNSSMPSQSYLTDEQIADALSFVRKNFGNKADAVTMDEVKKVRSETNTK